MGTKSTILHCYMHQFSFNFNTLIHLSELRLRNGQLHPGAICGGCYQQIYGVMHQCLVCPDYCLCSECKDSDVHKEHDMVGTHSPHGARGTYICSQRQHINMRVRQPGKVVVSCIGLLLCILDLVTSIF